MFVTLDEKDILAKLEGKAYSVIATMAADSKLENAEKEAQYNLGYTDGVADLCEELKGELRKYLKEKYGEELKTNPEEKEEEGKTSKYDN